MEWILALLSAEVLQAVVTIALAVAAATPTKDDDGVVGRVANVASLIIPALRK